MAKHDKITRIDARHGQRIAELGLAAAALFGLATSTRPIPHGHQAEVMKELDTLFGFSPAESDQASDMLFEATLNHAIAEHDRPRIQACANELTRIAANYRGTDEQDREIWAAGFELFEIDSLWEAANPPEREPRHDRLFENTAASHRFFDRF